MTLVIAIVRRGAAAGSWGLGRSLAWMALGMLLHTSTALAQAPTDPSLMNEQELQLANQYYQEYLDQNVLTDTPENQQAFLTDVLPTKPEFAIEGTAEGTVPQTDTTAADAAAAAAADAADVAAGAMESTGLDDPSAFAEPAPSFFEQLIAAPWDYLGGASIVLFFVGVALLFIPAVPLRGLPAAALMWQAMYPMLFQLGMGDYGYELSSLLPVSYVPAILFGLWIFLLWRGHSSSNSEARSEVVSSIPRRGDNFYARCEALRDALCQQVELAIERTGANAQAFTSAAYELPAQVWVRVTTPHAANDSAFLPGTVSIQIHPHDFHRFEQLITVVAQRSGVTRAISGVIDLQAADLDRLVRFATGEQELRWFWPRRIRQFSWQLWRPENRVTATQRIDLAVWASMALGVVGFSFLADFGWVLVMIAILAGAAIFYLRRKRFTLTSGKPLQEPRRLLRMDSWQTNVLGLGIRHAQALDALRAALASGEQHGMSVTEERIAYDGVDGKVERKQIVIRLRRALAFVHVYAYGDDLYVGWDAHLNAGAWAEEVVKTGLDRKTSAPVRLVTLKAGWISPNEYDVTDGNFLIEWTHAVVTKVTRALLAEYRIDQEIDFQIQRETRKGLAGWRAQGAPASDTSFVSRFRRVG